MVCNYLLKIWFHLLLSRRFFYLFQLIQVSLLLLIQEVLDVKLRLHQIEMEMTKLRSKQAEKKNDFKSNLQLNSSKLFHASVFCVFDYLHH